MNLVHTIMEHAAALLEEEATVIKEGYTVAGEWQVTESDIDLEARERYEDYISTAKALRVISRHTRAINPEGIAEIEKSRTPPATEADLV